MPPESPRGAQQTDFLPGATTNFSSLPTTGLVWKLSLGKTIHLHSWGPHKFPNSSWTPPLRIPPSSRKQLDWLGPIIPTKGWNVRSLLSLGRLESPKTSIETRPPWFMATRKTLLLVSLLSKPQELPVSQLVMHVDPFLLLITDKWRPVAKLFSGRNILPPSWYGPSYKAPYPFQLSCCTLIPRVSPAVCAPINLSFRQMAQSLFGSSLQL
jgi:hypothetical protein